MISESEVRGRYQAYAEELARLDAEIQRLQLRVRLGTDNWRADLEQLAERAERRRALGAQQQALQWVLTPDMGEADMRAYGRH